MSPSDFGFKDLDVINDHFPDGVDVAMVHDRWITEFTADTDQVLEYIDKVIAPAEKAPSENMLMLYLEEIEPETGIYAVMSPITHRVYVYVSPEYG